MAATPLTTECRAIVARLRAFPNMEGNVNYLRKLIYEDSKTLGQLTAELEAIEPAVDEDAVRAMYSATSTVGSVGEGSGNTGLWPRVQLAADAVEGACDLVEAAGDEEPEAKRSKPQGRRKGAAS